MSECYDYECEYDYAPLIEDKDEYVILFRGAPVGSVEPYKNRYVSRVFVTFEEHIMAAKVERLSFSSCISEAYKMHDALMEKMLEATMGNLDDYDEKSRRKEKKSVKRNWISRILGKRSD